MIISHELRFVYLGIPRTANRATHQMLLDLPGAERVGLLHCMDVPPECNSYFKFCCVRNPYRRMLAYYLWRRMPHPWPSEAKGMSFVDYLEACRVGKMGPNSIEEFVGHTKLDATYRYEGLPDSLHALEPFVPGIRSLSLPTVGRRLSRHWQYFYDSATAKLVFNLARSDFEQFGYPGDSWRILSS